jgi:glycosyltransferase involved in cell wall biosynthesis
MSTRVLYVVHHHPSVMAGGAENYALELYTQVRDTDGDLEPLLLAGTGPSGSGRGTPHPGTLIEPVGGDPGQYFFHTDAADYDWFLSTARNKEFYTRYLADFLRAYKPDVVHVQHSLFFGFDLIRTIRTVLPPAAIVYTLHEYLPLCFRDGQLLTTGGKLCTGPSPRKCGSCFPDITPQDFFLRERFIKAALAEVDRFVCPSRFLLEAYADWGIPREKLVHEQNGRLPVRPAARRVVPGSTAAAPRNRFGYFGQFTRYKGADVLLEAMSRLASREERARGSRSSRKGDPKPTRAADAELGAARPELVLHGANLEHAPQDFQDRFHGLLGDNAGSVRLHGRYTAAELPALMADVDWVVVPSIWYENAPLVIQEAFQHGKPVICSDIGGMAEAVTDGVDGLHFRAGSAGALADVLARAAGTPGLWDELAAGVRPVRAMTDHVTALEELYRAALAERRAPADPPGATPPAATTTSLPAPRRAQEPARVDR